MIQENCTSKQWISDISAAKKADRVLVQKLIRAILLLEGLVESNLKFVFKGGTALMLMLDSTKRLSIDIDIILPIKPDGFDKLLSEIATHKGFTKVEEKKRTTKSGIEKSHYKFYFPCTLRANIEEFVLLDILFEENHYSNLISTPIESPFIAHNDIILRATTPDFNNIMGDKLTAFAPNTTGIPYFKKDKPMGQEIIKQLYDIGNLFERIDDINTVRKVFIDFAKVELKYRSMGDDTNIVLDDIIENCLTISLREPVGKANFEVLKLGLKQIISYIFSEPYHIEKATTHAARTAYLATLLRFDTPAIRYNAQDMKDWLIEQPYKTKLNKLKRTNPEAFYYWYRIYELTTRQI